MINKIREEKRGGGRWRCKSKKKVKSYELNESVPQVMFQL